MKRSTIVWLTLGFILLQYLVRIPYYKYLLSDMFHVQGNIDNILTVFNLFTLIILDLIIIVLGARALGHSNEAEKDKAYSMFRYIYVMAGIFAILISGYWLTLSDRVVLSNLIMRAVMVLGQSTLVILLIKCKPQKQVYKVNLKDYDMVSYTSTGHRFVHYLLDLLFLVPVLLSVIKLVSFRLNYSFPEYRALQDVVVELIMLVGYLLYCFLSEAIFRQTFGKVITRSCVVSNGVDLSTGRIFQRTLCRLIPFDRFSFLFGAKWHDRASATAVVYVGSWVNTFEEPEKI